MEFLGILSHNAHMHKFMGFITLLSFLWVGTFSTLYLTSPIFEQDVEEKEAKVEKGVEKEILLSKDNYILTPKFNHLSHQIFPDYTVRKPQTVYLEFIKPPSFFFFA